jgi:glutamate racemase
MAGERQLPIGVFDSGIGGLTVLRAIHAALPHESTLYLGDTARVPYGTKSREVVTRYALNNAKFLVHRGIKLLVVACNTASAVALPSLTNQLEVPVIGVIEPGAKRACELSRTRKVGVIGTEGTIASGAYQEALERIDPDLDVRARPCPLFVPLAEEGWQDHPVTRQVAVIYLSDWTSGQMDTLILGCTHYPVLVSAIASALDSRVSLVDSASVVAKTVADRLGQLDLTTGGEEIAKHHFCVTDVPERFRAVGQTFLGRALDQVEQVDIEPS